MVRFGRGSASVELATRHAACSARSTRRLTARGAPGSRCADKAQKGGLPCECRLISPALTFTKRGKIELVQGTNTTSIRQREWSLFGKIKIKNDGSFGGGDVGRDLEVKGVCSPGQGRDTIERFSTNTRSGAGSNELLCEGGSPAPF
jgi:hypothetical protein